MALDRPGCFRVLHLLLEEGVPVVEALEALARESEGRLREALDAAARKTAEGADLSAVLEEYPDLFPKDVVARIRMAEQVGDLPEACARMADGPVRLQAETCRTLARLLDSGTPRPKALAQVAAMVRGTSFQPAWDQIAARGSMSGATGPLFPSPVPAALDKAEKDGTLALFLPLLADFLEIPPAPPGPAADLQSAFAGLSLLLAAGFPLEEARQSFPRQSLSPSAALAIDQAEQAGDLQKTYLSLARAVAAGCFLP